MADYVSGEDQPYDDRHTPRPVDPGTRPCGNVGPFGGYTCTNRTGHNGAHEASLAGVRMVWSDATDESVAKQLAALQRKVRAQANQINKLEDLRRAAVDKQPEFQALKRHLDSRVAELDRDRRSERERGDRFQEELRQALVKSGSMESGRFYRLAGLLGVDTAGETWDTLLQRVADLKAELEVERVRANARKAELDKLNVRLTDPFDPRMFLGPSAEYGTTPLAARVDEMSMGPSAEYGTTPLAARVDELAKTVAEMSMGPSTERRDLNRLIGLVGAENWNNRRHLVSVTDLGDMAEGLRSALVELERRTDELAMKTVRRCESWNSGTRCVGYPGHAGAHSGPGTERWA